MPIRSLALLLLLLLSQVFPVKALKADGTGGGGEYISFVNRSFDFRIAMHKDWTCIGCENAEERFAGQEKLKSWQFKAPGTTGTWIRVEFLFDPDVRNLEDLRSKIDALGGPWYQFQRDGEAFVGFSSSPLFDNAEAADEYFLVAREQIIRITWATDRDPENYQRFKRMKDSISRASEAPKIIRIESTRKKAYKVGEMACLSILISDLGLDKEISALEIEGVPSHFSFKSIRWVQDTEAFEACFKVRSSFQRQGLRVKDLSISLGEHESVCKQSPKKPDVLRCGNGAGAYDVPQDITPVDNKTPDREGPTVHSLQLQDQRLAVHAWDASGLYLAQIFAKDLSVVVFPDDLRQGRTVDISSILLPGWNTIDKIMLFDSNGLPTLLRVKGADKLSSKKKRNAFEEETYEMLTWDGKVVDTTLPVMSLLQRGAQK